MLWLSEQYVWTMLYRLWLAKNAECSADSDIPARFWFVPVFLNDLFFYRLNSFCLWDCARAGPAEFRHHFKAFLFQNSVLSENKSTKREPAITETENSKFKIQNTNPDHMQQQSGMFSSVFNLNVLFNLSDDLSTLRARPVCELYTDFKTKQV